MGGPQSISTLDGAGLTLHRPLSLWKYLMLLALGMIALVAYIALQRDIRLKRYTQEQAAWYAGALADKVGNSKTLPLNLEVTVPPETDRQMFDIVWLSRDDARVLRNSAKPVIVGRSLHLLRRVLTPDGWMVVTFHDGRFFGGWLSRAEYDRAIAEQNEELRRLGNEQASAER